MFKTERFLGHITEQDLSFVKTSNNDNILSISYLGKELLNKHSHWADYHSNGRRCFHLLHPAILDDEAMDTLIARTNYLISALRANFKGRIFIIGAFPRHLEACQATQWY